MGVWAFGMDAEAYRIMTKTHLTEIWALWTVYRRKVDILDDLSSG